MTAGTTTELSLPAEIRYLATWRFLAAVEVREKRADGGGPPGSVWEQIRRVASPEPPFLYVPAFTLTRITVQQLGMALVQTQPRLELEVGLPETRSLGPRLVGGGTEEEEGPGFGALSPVLLSLEDAASVAHFVYLAVESGATSGLRSIDYDLDLTGGELLFIPAVYDRRHVRDSFWRFLLREFDGLVA